MKQDNANKINSGTILLVFVAILAGLVGTYTVRQAMASTPVPEPVVPPPPPPAPPKPEVKMTVPLASRDIPSGTEITLDDIALYRLTRDEIKESVKAKTFMTYPSQIIGKIAEVDLKRDESFDTKNLLPAGRMPALTGRLKPGLRAGTVPLTPANALLGFAGPGERVDVLFHYGTGEGNEGAVSAADPDAGFQPGHHDFNPPRRRDYYGNTIGGANGLDASGFQSATSTLIQDAELLAIDNHSTPSRYVSPIGEVEMVRVTLAVSPRQAEMLRVAIGHGALSITLRANDDEQLVRLEDPVTLDHLIGVDSSSQVMEIYRGKALTNSHLGSNTSIRKRSFSDPADTSR